MVIIFLFQIAQLLSSVVTELGLMTKLKWRLVEAKSRTEREREDLSHHIESECCVQKLVLERPPEFVYICCLAVLKKRVAETEMKQKELKRKSECFDSLADMGRKRRASSTPSSVLSAASPSPEERPTWFHPSGTHGFSFVHHLHYLHHVPQQMAFLVTSFLGESFTCIPDWHHQYLLKDRAHTFSCWLYGQRSLLKCL